MFAALDHPASQCLPRDLDAVPAQHRFEAMQRQAIDILGGQQHGQYAWTGHALFDQLRWLISGDWRRFTASATVNLAHMSDHADLHRHDIELLAGFLANDMLAATAGTRQLVLRQLVGDYDTWQVCRQRLALATTLDRGNDFFVGIVNHGQQQLAFRLVEQRQLRCIGLDRLFGFAREQAVAQQLDLFFQVEDMPFIDGALLQQLRKQLLEQYGIVRKVIGHGNHGPDYTGSGDETWRQNLMGTIAPEVKAVE